MHDEIARPSPSSTAEIASSQLACAASVLASQTDEARLWSAPLSPGPWLTTPFATLNHFQDDS